MSVIKISGPMLYADGQIRPATLALQAGTITTIEPELDSQADVVTEGCIAPGLIDLQLNGGYGVDFTSDGSLVGLVAERLPATGVTGFLPTIITSPLERYQERIKQIATAQGERRAHILGIHLEGPYLNPRCKGAHDPQLLRAIDVDEVLAWADHPLVRLVTLAPELPGALAAIRALTAKGVVVSAGHSDATFEEAEAGCLAGIRWGTHLFNAMHPLQHREPGLPGQLLLTPLPCGIIPDGVHVHPAMLKLALRLKGVAGLTLVTDAMAAMGMPPGTYRLGDRAVLVDGTSARLADGTLAGSILTLDQAVRNMQLFTRCSLAEALYMASTGPARLLALTKKGVLAPGNDADIVVFDRAQCVTHTFVAGSLAFERSPL